MYLQSADIISETATVMPIKELIPLFKKRGIRVLIDGAHAIGRTQAGATQDMDTRTLLTLRRDPR